MLQSIPYVVAAALFYYMLTQAIDAGFLNAVEETSMAIEEVETHKERHRNEIMGILDGDHDEQ